MTFRLERKSVGATLTKFHVVDSAGTIVGSINVANEQASDLRKCWRDSVPAVATTADKHTRAVNALAAALKRGPRLSREAKTQGDFARLLTSWAAPAFPR